MICSEKAPGPFAATCIGSVPYASVLSRDLSRLSREAGYLCSIQASRLTDIHFLPHTRAYDAIRPRTAFERGVPKSPSDQRAGRWFGIFCDVARLVSRQPKGEKEELK